MANTSRPITLSLGQLPSEWVSHVSADLRLDIKAVDLDSLGEDLKTARVLLIGEGVEPGELETFLLAIRETAPSVALFAVAGMATEYPTPLRGVTVDALFQIPRDQAALNAAIRESLVLTGSAAARKNDIVRTTLSMLAGVVGILLVWSAVSRVGVFSPYILPAPEQVATTFLDDSLTFLRHTLVTAAEALAGFLLGNAFGGVVAILLHRFGVLRRASLPVLTGLQALPIVALAPLLAVWLGTGAETKAAMSAIVCFFPVVSNLLAAFGAVDRDLAQLFVFHRASYWTTLVNLLIPASVPAVIAGLRISGGLAVVGAIVAEFTGADQGLGHLILNASYRLQTDRLFVAILLSGVLGALFAGAPSLLRLTAAGQAGARP